MAGTGRIYRRGDIYYIAYRWDGREYRESARSAQRGVAEHLLATRLRERRGSPPPADLTFDALAAWYLDDYMAGHGDHNGSDSRLSAAPPPGGRGRGDGQPGDVGAESDVPPRGAQSPAR